MNRSSPAHGVIEGRVPVISGEREAPPVMLGLQPLPSLPGLILCQRGQINQT